MDVAIDSRVEWSLLNLYPENKVIPRGSLRDKVEKPDGCSILLRFEDANKVFNFSEKENLIPKKNLSREDVL